MKTKIERLFVIGDSFAVPCRYSNNWSDDWFWPEVIRNRFNISKENIVVDGAANRDVQTIIDNWIKLIKYLTKTDLVIICLPFFQRSRLPLEKSNWAYWPTDSKIKITNRFCGPQMADIWNIEFWGKQYSSAEWMQKTEIQQIINSSDAAIYNSIEVIESLVKMTPSKLFVFTWDDMKIKSNLIFDRLDFENEIGLWHTLNDEWNETNGESGFQNDYHWSSLYNSMVGDYIVKRFDNIKYL